MIQKGKDGNLKAMGKKSLPRELFRKSSHQPLISDESDVVLLSGQYKFIWHYLPGMHASFHWKQRSNGRKSKQSGGNRRAGQRAAGSWALDGKISVPTVTIITNNLAR